MKSPTWSSAFKEDARFAPTLAKRPGLYVVLGFGGLPCPTVTPGGSHTPSELRFPVSHQPAQLLAWIVTKKPQPQNGARCLSGRGVRSGEGPNEPSGMGLERDASGGRTAFPSRLQRKT